MESAAEVHAAAATATGSIRPDDFRRRRERFLEQIGEGVAVLGAAPELV